MKISKIFAIAALFVAQSVVAGAGKAKASGDWTVGGDDSRVDPLVVPPKDKLKGYKPLHYSSESGGNTKDPQGNYPEPTDD